MKLILDRMRLILPTINKYPQSLKRLIRGALENYAELYFVPMSFDGYFVPAHLSPTGNPQIYINSRLSEDAQRIALAHELTHLACHARTDRILFNCPQSHDFTDIASKLALNEVDQQEFEAQSIGVLALFPAPSLQRTAQLDLFDSTEPEKRVIEAWMLRLELREYKL